MTQNNCELVAKNNLEKRIRLKGATLFENCKMKWKIIVILKCEKMFLFEKTDKSVQFNSLFLEKS